MKVQFISSACYQKNTSFATKVNLVTQMQTNTNKIRITPLFSADEVLLGGQSCHLMWGGHWSQKSVWTQRSPLELGSTKGREVRLDLRCVAMQKLCMSLNPLVLVVNLDSQAVLS